MAHEDDAPRPWLAWHHCNPAVGDWYIIDNDGKPVHPTLEHVALQAAAPDMLKTLRKAQAFLDVLEQEYVCTGRTLEGNSNDADGRLDWDVRFQVQDAIAKAKGE